MRKLSIEVYRIFTNSLRKTFSKHFFEVPMFKIFRVKFFIIFDHGVKPMGLLDSQALWVGLHLD